MAPESKDILLPKAPSVSVIHTNLGMAEPNLARDVFQAHIGPNTKALIIQGWATGTVHEALLPYIQDATQKGVSVFILSDNPANTHGIRSLKYEPHIKAVEAGAIPLRDVNINNANEVLSEIQNQIDQGKIGEELKEAVIQKFGTPIPQAKT